MRFVLGQELGEVLAARGPARVAVVVHHAASGKGLVDLLVQVVAVGEDQKGEVAAQLAMDLAGEKYHGIALARNLGMPEHQGNRMKFSLTHQSSIKSGSGSRQSGGGYGHEHEHEQIDHELFFVDSRSPDDSQDET